MSKGELAVTGPKKDNDEIDPNGYEVKDAADTLLRAQEIKNNKKLMPHVHRHLNKKKKAVITSLNDLKMISQKKRNQAAGIDPDGGIDEDTESPEEKKKEKGL